MKPLTTPSSLLKDLNRENKQRKQFLENPFSRFCNLLFRLVQNVVDLENLFFVFVKVFQSYRSMIVTAIKFIYNNDFVVISSVQIIYFSIISLKLLQ
jgi:hypothetical protein